MAQKAAPGRADRVLLTSRANARPKGSFHPLPWRCAGCVQGAGTRGTHHAGSLQRSRGDAMSTSLTTDNLPSPRDGQGFQGGIV